MLTVCRVGLREALVVKITAVYCAITFAAIQILYLAVWCRPVTNYWAVPIPEGNGKFGSCHFSSLLTLGEKKNSVKHTTTTLSPSLCSMCRRTC